MKTLLLVSSIISISIVLITVFQHNFVAALGWFLVAGYQIGEFARL